MRSLNQSITEYLKQGTRPRKVVRVRTAAGVEILRQATREWGEYEDRIAGFGEISQSVEFTGGMAEVSGASINNLILDERLTLCDEGDLSPKIDGVTLGAGRLLSPATGSYTDARNAASADFASVAIVVGRSYNAGSDLYTVFRGPVQFAVDAALTTCEDAYIYLLGYGDYSATDFSIEGYLGSWSTLGTDPGGAFDAFDGHEASGDYTGDNLVESWTTAEYDDEYDSTLAKYIIRLRLNALGRAQVVAAAGGTFRLMLVSSRDSDADIADPSGNEYVMFEAGSARLKLRYNSQTLDNQIAEIYYALEDSAGNIPATVGAMDLVWSGVVDSYVINDRMLSLECRQNDHKKNRMLPGKIITTTEWPNCPEGNIGKAVPVVYGEFAVTSEHRTGTANFEGLDPNGDAVNWSYPDCIKGYVVAISSDARTVLFADHYLKDYVVSHLLFAWNSSTKAFEPLACIATQTSDSKGHYRELTATWSDQIPLAFAEGKFRAAGAVLPTGYTHSGAVNPQNAYDISTDTYAELTQNDYIDFYFSGQMGAVDNGIVGFVVYAVFIGGAAANGLHAITYEDQRDAVDTSPNWVEKSDDTPWSADGTVAWQSCEVNDTTTYKRIPIQLGQYKLRLVKTDASGTAKITDVCAMVSRDVGEELEFYTHAKGKRDSALGTVTGTGYLLIENPSHVIESLARDEMELTASEIDTGAFDTAATALGSAVFAFQLLERERSRGVLDDLGAQGRLKLWWDEQDRLTAKALGTAASPGGFANSGTDIPGARDIFDDDGAASGGSWVHHPIMGGVEIELIGADDAKNDIVVKYKKNMASGEYEAVLTCDKSGTNVSDGDLSGTTGAELVALCLASYNRVLTVNTLEVEAWGIRDEATAARLLQHLVEWRSPRRRVVKFPAAADAISFDLGDFVNVRHDRIEDLYGTAVMNRKKWMVIGMDPNLNKDLWGMRVIEV